MIPDTPENKTSKARARKRAWAKAHPESSRVWHKNNPEKAHACSRAWNKSHPEKVRLSVKTWQRNNPEKVRFWKKTWHSNNLEKDKASARNWWATQAAQRTNHYFAKNLRTRMYLALRRCKRVSRYSELLGCSISEFRAHIEAQFKPGMTWENYGSVWHIDHRRPCARFDLSKPEEQKACFHFTNLQPLWARENIIKGAKAHKLVESDR